MKNVCLSLILLVASVAANASQFDRRSFTERADLTRIQMDEKLDLRVYAANVEINHLTNKVVLNLQITPSCPKGALCASIVGPMFHSIELPVVKKEVGACGATVYTARRDARPVDGNLEEITVLDNRTLVCKIAVHQDRMTIVTYKVETNGRLTHGTVEYQSILTGETLHSALDQ